MMGAVVMAIAAVQHVRYCSTLKSEQLPSAYWQGFSIWVTGLLAILSASLGVYLVISMLQ